MFTVQQYQDDQVTYVPDFLNNRDLAEQWIDGGSVGPRPFFTVELLPMSGDDYNRVSGRTFKKTQVDGNFIQGAERVKARIIKKYVPSVDGLAFARRDGSVAKPTNGGELNHEVKIGYKALSDLTADIFEALSDISKADEGDLKKLQQRFVGSTQPTISNLPPELGDVPDATRNTSPTRMSQVKTRAVEPGTVTE